MNIYLFNIGSNINRIRELLGWSQAELANKMGISQQSVNNLEKDPTNLSKMHAITLYTIVLDEIEKRKTQIDNIDFSIWNDSSKREALIKKASSASSLTSTLVIMGALTLPVSATLLAVGRIALAASMVNGRSGIKDAQKKFANFANILAKPKKAKDEKISGDEVKAMYLESIDSLKVQINAFYWNEEDSVADVLGKIDENESA